MKEFLDENFLLNTATAQQLFASYAKEQPIIDYHCHLSPEAIARDHRFANITEAWLKDDHYKWRAMRGNGVEEDYCTGNKPDWEKFQQWANTVPYTLRNPLYHWTHLELQRYFNIKELLQPASARKIYDTCNEMLTSPEFSVRNLLRKMKVKVVGTTDDPLDSLAFHRQLREERFAISVVPSFRPDRAMNATDPALLNIYIDKMEEVSGRAISHFDEYLEVLKGRHDFFGTMGCRVSDHGLEEIYADPFTDREIRDAFDKLRAGKELGIDKQRQFKSAMLLHFARWDWEKGWVQQFHLGAMRNNNTRSMQLLGADTGWDSIGDFPQAKSLARFLDTLDRENHLAKTILYNLNPADNAVMATMACNFNDGSVPGKIQWGAAWWFLDQQDGIIQQLNTLSNMGLLSRFVGMITDSRSFLSFPRHEYFRRILCNVLGEEVERGELPSDLSWIGETIGNICYQNAQSYFNFGANQS